MSKERVLTEEAKFENTYNEFLSNILSQKRGDFEDNRLGASTLATHEAKIKHHRYPKELVEKFDLETTYIPVGVVDWGKVNPDGSFKLTESIGSNAKAQNVIKAGKVYFNVSDKLFYRFNGDSFTVIDIAEFK